MLPLTVQTVGGRTESWWGMALPSGLMNQDATEAHYKI